MAGKKSKSVEPVENIKLVPMEKDGMQLKVHPTTVESHKLVGWKVVEKSPSKKPAKTIEEPIEPSEPEKAEE